MEDKYRDSDLLALPLAIALSLGLCYITDMIMPKEAAMLVSLLGALTIGRYARKMIRKVLNK